MSENTKLEGNNPHAKAWSYLSESEKFEIEQGSDLECLQVDGTWLKFSGKKRPGGIYRSKPTPEFALLPVHLLGYYWKYGDAIEEVIACTSSRITTRRWSVTLSNLGDDLFSRDPLEPIVNWKTIKEIAKEYIDA